MADQIQYPGRLIAIDGTRAKDASAAAASVKAALAERHLECAVSRFDASGLFGELAAAGRPGGSISARTLALVYAADLAFRLRWEIRPVLEAGGIVIAAPYVESAVAIGAAHGLEEEWIRELLRFAPRPNVRGLAGEKKMANGWKPRLDRGYGEYCAAMLRAEGKAASRPARRRAVALLHRSRPPRAHHVADDDGIAAIARAVTGSLRVARSRSASTPRSLRT
jgi:hypothetical protein